MEKYNKVQPSKQNESFLSQDEEIPDEMTSDFVVLPDRLSCINEIRASCKF